MELRQLKYFVKIHQCRSFTAAAKELGVSQSALSLSIKELENSLGAQVFLRGSGGVTLTAVGESLLGYATAILKQHSKALTDIADIQTEQSTAIEIGVNSAFPRRFLDAVLQTFYQRAPGVTVKVYFSAHRSDAVVENLERASWDAAISLDPDTSLEKSKAEIHCESIATSHSQIYARKDHPIHQIDDVMLEDLKRFDWAVSTAVAHLRRIEIWNNEDGTRDLPVALYADSFDLILGAVSNVDLLCFAPDRLVEASGLPLIPVKQDIIAPLTSHWKLMYCDDLQLSNPAKMFLKCVRQVFDDRQK